MSRPAADSKQAPPLSRYRLLGSSGLRVSPIVLGTMIFGTHSSHGGDVGAAVTNKDEVFAILDEYVKLGGNFLDTADFYMMGQSEEWIGEWMQLRKNRAQLVIATKYSLPVNGDPNGSGNHRKRMLDALAASLRRLQTDYIDLYYTHFWDYTMDVEDVLRNFQDVIAQGKVHHAGISDTPAWVVAHGNAIAKVRGWHPFVAYQGRYNLLSRDMEFDIIPMAHYYRMSLVPWGALAEGKLTGKYKRGQEPDNAPRMKTRWATQMDERDYDIAETVEAVAKEVGATPSQVAIAWILRDPAETVLVGVRSVKHLTDNVGAVNVKLTDEQVKRLEAASKLKPVFPHSMVSTYKQKGLLHYLGNFTIE